MKMCFTNIQYIIIILLRLEMNIRKEKKRKEKKRKEKKRKEKKKKEKKKKKDQPSFFLP
jgi:hypothetical protein